MNADNDNELSDEAIEDTFDLFDWVRPICTSMRANTIPEEVLQDTMGFLLQRLDQHLTDPTDLSPITWECLDPKEWGEGESEQQEESDDDR